ncbi:lipase class 3 [Rhizoctonia solani AG-3 Rhs1AP]|uniref:Lipase class 3 n=2 Tax=Rhizoctonia solani AG-3 TaxID=1086053 RepID=X8IX27_9AGAM|nr:lipase class 3 [Rhizoctonia solani AG-3 Rhs1AP]
MAALNAHQQVFALSLMANLLQKNKGTREDLQRQIQKKLPLALLLLGGDWRVTWGPVVWKYSPDDAKTGPDHVWFVARNPNLKFPNGEQKDTYVLAVAGTTTDYNWVVNNARVDKVVDYHKWLEAGITTPPKEEISTSHENCYIAYGIALGVYRLASIESPAASPGNTLPSYWASFPDSSETKVILTGHSLGGALSPSLAFGLLESGAFSKFKPNNILVYPTAGPTAGNLVFADLFAQKFPKVPGSGYQVWNYNVINELDIVSQAWCISKDASPAQNMGNIPTIYGSPAILAVSMGVAAASLWASASGTIYVPIPAIRFKGTPPASRPTTMKGFLKEALKQHGEEFIKEFQLPIPTEVLSGEEEGIEKMTEEEAEGLEPVLQDIVNQIKMERLAAEPGQAALAGRYQAIAQLSEGFAP